MKDITFIIPHRSPEICHSWEKASDLCNRTLASLRNQTHPNWQCVLVCNRAPIGMIDDSRIAVIEHDFPIPYDRQSRMHDKGQKKSRGLEWLLDHPSRYAMLVDDDDLLHCDLAEFIASRSADGWIVAEGYNYYEGHWPFLVTEPQFNQHCGTCYALRVDDDLQPQPEEIAEHPLMRPHETIENFFAQRGRPLDRVPFRSVIQCRATGENTANNDFAFLSWRSFLKLVLRSRPLTPRIRANFALHHPSLEPNCGIL